MTSGGKPHAPALADEDGPIAATIGRLPAARSVARYSVIAITDPEYGNKITAGVRSPSASRAALESTASTTSAPASRRAGAIRLGRSCVRGSKNKRPVSGPAPSLLVRIA